MKGAGEGRPSGPGPTLTGVGILQCTTGASALGVPGSPSQEAPSPRKASSPTVGVQSGGAAVGCGQPGAAGHPCGPAANPMSRADSAPRAARGWCAWPLHRPGLERGLVPACASKGLCEAPRAWKPLLTAARTEVPALSRRPHAAWGRTSGGSQVGPIGPHASLQLPPAPGNEEAPHEMPGVQELLWGQNLHRTAT